MEGLKRNSLRARRKLTRANGDSNISEDIHNEYRNAIERSITR